MVITSGALPNNYQKTRKPKIKMPKFIKDAPRNIGVQKTTPRKKGWIQHIATHQEG